MAPKEQKTTNFMEEKNIHRAIRMSIRDQKNMIKQAQKILKQKNLQK